MFILNPLFNKSYVSCRVAEDQAAGSHIFGDDGAGGDERPGADGEAGEDDGACADGSVVLKDGLRKAGGVAFAFWIPIIGKGGIGSDEDVIADAQAVPELNPAFDGDTVADDDIIFNEDVGTDVAVRSDSGLGEHDDKLPDAGAVSNVGGGDVGERVNEGAAGGSDHELLWRPMEEAVAMATRPRRLLRCSAESLANRFTVAALG
jgi:hypothetical protein